MSANLTKNNDYKSLAQSAKSNGTGGKDLASLKPSRQDENAADDSLRFQSSNNLINHHQPEIIQGEEPVHPEEFYEPPPIKIPVKSEPESAASAEPVSYSEETKRVKTQKKIEKDWKLLNSDRWIIRNGHDLTYIGVFLFTAVVYFRPYDWVPGFQSLTSIALVFAVLTVLIYIPTQLSTEGSLTIMTTEVKCALFLAFWSVLTMPIAKDPGLSWKIFNETFSKILLIFIIMVNTLRTKERLKGLMWLSIGIGVMLSYQAVQLYREGKFAVEGYRVEVDFGGMFGNPNDMALHLVIFIPVAVALGIISKNLLSKIIYWGSAILMVGAITVTQSRGGFIGLIAITAILAWKLGKKQRLKVVLVTAFFGLIFIALAPGNYGLRMLSIFIPALDPVGSADQRRELLQLSLLVTARNPFGIGLGNFPIVGIRNLQTHNAYTQVSAELGWLSFAAYVLFMVSPLRKLAAIERRMFAENDESWIYYLSIGLQVSIIGYMVSSFFVSVAYQWFIYFPIAYAVCLRRIYKMQKEKEAELTQGDTGGDLDFQKA